MHCAGNNTLLSGSGLSNITLNVSALVPDLSCPNGGLLNVNLGLGSLCAGVVVIGDNGVLQVCVQNDASCCCSPGLLRPSSDLFCEWDIEIGMLDLIKWRWS
jgi:hypothetical protein